MVIFKKTNRLKTIKLLEENMGSPLFDIGLFEYHVYLDKGNKRKNKQTGLHQTTELLQRKGNQEQNEKTTHQPEENICKSYIWEGVYLQNI